MVKAFDSISNKEEENENIIPLFEEAINISASKDQLKYQCVNFIADLCVVKINGKRMKNERALELLVKAFQMQPKNSRIAHNLAILTKFNCMDMFNGGISSPCRSKLQEIIRIKNQPLIQNIKSELFDLFFDFMRNLENNNDPDVVRLFERAIGIRFARPRSPFDDIILGGKSLNDEGRDLASKLKIIYQLMGEPLVG